MTSPDEIADDYWTEGHTFKAAYFALSDSFELTDTGRFSQDHPTSPAYYIASHACELYLKAWLLRLGVDNKELRSLSIRHSLTGLLEMAGSHQSKLSEYSTKTLKYLSHQHQHHYFRYGIPDDSVAYLPHPKHMSKLLDDLQELSSPN